MEIFIDSANITEIKKWLEYGILEGGNASEVIKNSVEWLERWKYKSKIIVGSIRSVGDVLSAAMAKAHIITYHFNSWTRW